MEIAMRDGGLLSLILTRLSERQDLLSASMACKKWNDVLTWAAHKLTIRSPTLLPYFLSRFKHLKHLNLAQCFDQLQDSDLEMPSECLKNLVILSLGNPEQPQECISNLGFVGFVQNCNLLEQVALSSIPNLLDYGIEAMAGVCKGLMSLSIENCRNLSDGALEALKYCKNIQELTLKGIFRFTPSGLSKIGESCPRLLKLSLELDSSIDITSALKSLATHCLHLKELSLKFRRGDLRELSGLSNLIALRIETGQCDHQYSVASIVAANRNLKEFVYYNCLSPLNDAALTVIIQNCRNLEKLCLSASTLTESALLCIMECKALKSLALDDFSSEGQGLPAIGLCGIRLKEFSLASAKKVRDVELEILMYSNKQLERIHLKYCSGPSSKGFSTISLCSNLQFLDLSFTDVDDLSLVAIANGAKMLRHLSLVKCTAVSSMKILSNFGALEYLNVDQCHFVTDEGLGFLAASCSKLSYLNLASTRITDVGLLHLASCTMLRTLEIPYCRGVQGPGLVTIALSCKWIQYLVISYYFKGTTVLEELRKRCCRVQLEMDHVDFFAFW